MFSICSSLLFFSWLIVKRSKIAGILNILIFSFFWRLISSIYLNFSLNPYSSEGEKFFPVSDLALDMFGWVIFITIAIIYYILSSVKFKIHQKIVTNSLTEPQESKINTIFFWALIFFIALLFLDLFRIGKIPIIDCIERYEYSANYAGIFHKFFIKYLFIFGASIGYFLITFRKKIQFRYIIPIIFIFIYFVLTSNRFSSYFQLLSFLLMPLCILIFSHGKYSFVLIRPFLIFLILIIAFISSFSLYYSYSNFRDQGGKCNEVHIVKNSFSTSIAHSDIAHSDFKTKKIVQRIFVQPSEMFFMTFDRVVIKNDFNPMNAISFIFNIDKCFEGNRSIRYLMNNSLSADRALYLESVKNQFAGGYPEILLELFGHIYFWPFVILFAVVTGYLFRFFILFVCAGNFISCISVLFVLYPFLVFYIGGMMNFLVAWTFWVKVLLMLLISSSEYLYLNKRGLNIFSLLIKVLKI